jgi:hypothetical protein
MMILINICRAAATGIQTNILYSLPMRAPDVVAVLAPDTILCRVPRTVFGGLGQSVALH